MLSCAVVLAAVIGAATFSRLAAPGSDRRPRTPAIHADASPAAQQSRSSPGPDLPPQTAERNAMSVADAMGAGSQVVSATIMTVAAADRVTGQQVASDLTDADRQVWLIWLRGPYRILNCIKAGACPTRPHALYYIAVDARTGTVYGVGWRVSYPASRQLPN